MRAIENSHNFIYRLLPLFFVLLNFILKILNVSVNAISRDEPFSIYHAQMNPLSIIEHLKNGNNPPLYELFLHYWIKLFGISELAVRFPSILFSTIAVYFLYRIGKDFFTVPIAITTCLLFTFSSYQISIAHEARVYALFLMLTLISMFLFIKICNSKAAKKLFVFLLLVNCLLIYSHYLGFFVLMLQTIILFAVKQYRFQFLKKYLLYAAALFILYLPNLFVLIKRFADTTAYGTWVQAPNGIDSLYSLFVQFSNAPFSAAISLLLIFITLIKIFLTKNYRVSNLNSNIIILWFAIPLFVMFFLSYLWPMFVDKYLVFVSPAYYFVIAMCCHYLFNNLKGRNILALFFVLCFAITFKTFVYNKRDVKETIAQAATLKKANDMLIISPKHFVLNFVYYYDRQVFEDVDSENVYDKVLESLQKQNIYAANSINVLPIQQFQNIVFLDAGANFSYPDNNIKKTIEQSFYRDSTYQFYEIFNVTSFTLKKLQTNN